MRGCVTPNLFFRVAADNKQQQNLLTKCQSYPRFKEVNIYFYFNNVCDFNTLSLIKDHVFYQQMHSNLYAPRSVHSAGFSLNVSLLFIPGNKLFSKNLSIITVFKTDSKQMYFKELDYTYSSFLRHNSNLTFSG